MNFYELEPDQIKVLDLQSLTSEELRELAYFCWCFYQQDEDVMRWRSEKLLPLVSNLPPLMDEEFGEEAEGDE